MESFIEINNDTNSSMLNKSFNNYLPQKPCELRNKRCNADNKTHNSTKDTKYNAVSNINSSFQKTFSIFNESNYDSNSQTERSSNNLKEIKAKVTSKPIKNSLINMDNHDILNIENSLKDMSSFNKIFQEEAQLKKISKIQKWWKNTYKVITIQKYIKGFLIRKKISNLIYFIRHTFKLLFKLVAYNIKNNIQQNNITFGRIDYLNNTEISKTLNKKMKKTGTNAKFSKNIGLKNHPSFKTSNIFKLNKKTEESKILVNQKLKIDLLKKYGTNNHININKTNTQFASVNNNLCFNKNKNNKNIKNKKEQKINNVSKKDKLIANNIFNIYNNVKKYYENENNNNINNNCNDSNYFTINNFYPKNSKNQNVGKNNKNKLKKMETRGSMKNINEKIVINKNNNINANININNNPKTDRTKKNQNNKSPNKNEIESILYLLKLKKAFLFWNSFITKKKIIQRLKLIKNMQTPSVKKTFSIYTENKTEKEKASFITTKKINFSNSIKKNKITPHKLKTQKNEKKNLAISHRYTKKINKHSNSVEKNNSMLSSKPANSAINCSFNFEKENNPINRKMNDFSNVEFNKSVIVVSQYDRNTEIKKKENNNNGNIITNQTNETKRAYYFYAIISLIDKHNKRKKIKKCFNTWKNLSRYNRIFINNYGIEEKIISFKSLKSPFKNNFNNKINKANSLHQNNSFGHFTCQTESYKEPFFDKNKISSNLIQNDLLTPDPLKNSNHPNLFKNNIKASQIVYQKKLLIPKKTRNQSVHTININEVEEDRNMTLIDDKKELNFMNQTIGNNFYNINSFINNNNSLNNSQYITKKNAIEKINNQIQEGRINKVNTIEETEIYFTPKQTETLKTNFIVGQKKIEDGYNNIINVNVAENFRKIDINKENRENNRYISINNGVGIATKQINFGEKNRKINSHSKEFRNINQSF